MLNRKNLIDFKEIDKILCVLVLLVLLSPAASAQKLFEKPVVFGLKMGFNGSFFTEDVAGFEPGSPNHNSSFERFLRFSPIIGASVDYTLNKHISFGAEILYNTRGMAYRQQNNNVIMIGQHGNETAYNYFKYRIEYIELPITVHFNFLPPVQDNWLTFYVGIAPAIAVSESVKFDYPQVTMGPGKEPDDINGTLSGVKAFNASLLSGLQFGSRPSVMGWFVDLRGSYALMPVFDDKIDGNGDNLDTQMLTFSLGFGLKF